MKRLITLLLIMFCFNSLKAQVNLVRDSSFEKYDSCGIVLSIDSLTYWYNSTSGTPDLLTPCNLSASLQPPSNYEGYQVPRTGVAYAGIDCYFNTVISNREYVSTKLQQRLVNGKKYKINFYLSLAEASQFAIDNIGVLFTKDSILGFDTDLIIDSIPQIISPSGVFYSDTINWMKVTMIYYAHGYENYMTIGNFKANSNTNKQDLQFNNSAEAYYYLDDVSVVEMDSDTVIIKPPIDTSHFIIPTFITSLNSNWHITYLPQHTHAVIYDEIGRVVMDAEDYRNDFEFTYLPAAVYFYKLVLSNGEVRKGKIVWMK